jgi:F-type H+-transporting ATPase subunit a
MLKSEVFFSPLEQFEIISLIRLNFGWVDISLTNSVFFMVLSVFLFLCLAQLVSVTGNGFLAPSRWQFIIESLYSGVIGITKETIGTKGDIFFPFAFSIFTFILTINLVGLVPYSFTVTSHLIVTIVLTSVIWFGKIFYGFRLHGLKIFGSLLPPGAPFALAPLLIMIEIISFCITLISLSVRLFANMMAGHILLKVLAGFAWTMMSIGGLLYLAHFSALGVIFILLGIETGVAVVQAYVFTMLTCLYLGDMISGGH